MRGNDAMITIYKWIGDIGDWVSFYVFLFRSGISRREFELEVATVEVEMRAYCRFGDSVTRLLDEVIAVAREEVGSGYRFIDIAEASSMFLRIGVETGDVISSVTEAIDKDRETGEGFKPIVREMCRKYAFTGEVS